ncbi:hypothetical protein [Amaricoccus solimangrovi]|uniref:Uncharacterized protein n=1 Tax=Amaricoccus solimangrovi TaxID=2589815 RepID=A0A501X0C8_9RHOB|nr:hypothetical protein [Amaricoccus solimangrovi]TPE53051.1 hypothetical protein FJM51_03225 [Amaricoccus solimangrovi]
MDETTTQAGRLDGYRKEIAALRAQAARDAEAVRALREALIEARHWHDSRRDDLGKQPPNNDINWRRMEHRDEIDRIDAALAATQPGEPRDEKP